jgi:LysM repeat protein
MVDRASPYFRLFAPLALGLFAVVFVVIVLASVAGTPGSEQASESSSSGSTDSPASKGSRRRDREKRLPSATYRVREGDTLAGIAAKTGRSPERLQEYNPDLDAQTLQPGQKLKLRE